MKRSLFGVVMAALAIQLAAPMAVSKADDCVLPVCNMSEQLDEFKAMRESRRFSFLEQMTGDYRDNNDVANARNIIEFTLSAKEIIKVSPDNKRTMDQANALLDQSYEQVAKYADLSEEALSPSFGKLMNAQSRFRVLAFWGAKIASLKDVNAVSRLREFYADAREICAAAKDEDYIVREATRDEQAANARIIELGPVNGSQLTFPVSDMARVLGDFKGLGVAERFLQVKGLVERYAGSSDKKALISLVEYAKGVAEILKGADAEQAQTVQTAVRLLTQSIDLLAHNADLNSDEMMVYFNQLAGAGDRFAAVQFWASKIAASKNDAFLRKLVRFFAAVVDQTKGSKELDYINREALNDENNAYKRIIEILPAPAFSVPVADMAAAVENYRNMDLPERFVLVKKLATDYAASTNAKAVASALAFGQAIRDILVAAGEQQKFILDQDDAFIAQSIDILVKSPDLSADDLIVYFKQLKAPQARLVVIQFWAGKVDAASTKAAVTRLIKFFQQARRVSNAAEDDDYIPRAAQLAEQAARKRLSDVK